MDIGTKAEVLNLAAQPVRGFKRAVDTSNNVVDWPVLMWPKAMEEIKPRGQDAPGLPTL